MDYSLHTKLNKHYKKASASIEKEKRACVSFDLSMGRRVYPSLYVYAVLSKLQSMNVLYS